MALPAVKLVDDLSVSSDTRLETLQRDYAELNTEIFEAAQVHRRLCAPSLVRTALECERYLCSASLPGDFFSGEQRATVVSSLLYIGGKGLAANLFTPSHRFDSYTHCYKPIPMRYHRVNRDIHV